MILYHVISLFLEHFLIPSQCICTVLLWGCMAGLLFVCLDMSPLGRVHVCFHVICGVVFFTVFAATLPLFGSPSFLVHKDATAKGRLDLASVPP